MVTYRYNIEKGFLETYFTGKVTKKEILDYFQYLLTDELVSNDLLILIDSSKGSLDLSIGQLYGILEENLKLFSKYNSLKVAIVLDKPVDTALAVIYTRLIQLENYQFHVFNTVSAASVWLKRGVG